MIKRDCLFQKKVKLNTLTMFNLMKEKQKLKNRRRNLKRNRI